MNAWTHVAGWVLVHFVWQGAVVALAAALALRLCRRQAASVRYVIACGAMTTMLSGVVATAALVNPPEPGGEAAAASSQSRLKGRIDVLLPIEMRNTPTSAKASSTATVEAVLPWIVSAWLFGVTVLLARACAGWWRVRCLHRIALSSMHSTWQAAGNRIASRLGLRRVIRVVQLPHLDVPLVIGCLRPIVVLPIAVISQLDVAQVEAILAHELAHVRRHDYVVNLMQTLAETLLFYHPGVWWLSARIREEREHCCDDVAVAVCGDPVGYAAALTELEAGRGRQVSLAAAATGGSLLHRVRRILRVEMSDDSRTSSWAVAIAVAAFASGLALTVVAQAPAPDEAQSFEVASVRANTSGDARMSSQVLPGGRYTAINIPARLLIINSYGLQPQQLIGAPDWISSERFDIVAKAESELDPPESRDAPSQLQLMIRSLLAERFKLKVHREPREVDIYALVPVRRDGRLGPELKPSATDCDAVRAARRKSGPPPEPPRPGERPQCGARVGAGELVTDGQPLLELVSLLSATVGRSVVDRTGLKGTYDIYLKWTPDFVRQRATGETVRINGVEFDPSGPSIFTALQEQLGLKLESERGTVEALVIDHIERPTPD
jgi:uncharacterized protein (TIGR03435 family)